MDRFGGSTFGSIGVLPNNWSYPAAPPEATLKLECQNAEAACHPGDTLSGTLSIFSERPFALRKISVVLEGNYEKKPISVITMAEFRTGVVRTWIREDTDGENISAMQHKVCFALVSP